MTAAQLEARLGRHFRCTRGAARRVVRRLIASGRLAYVYLYGQSYIDLGFRRPTPVSRRVVLYPPECVDRLSPHEFAVVIAPGAAFGDGRHPTTRLALEGLETIRFAPDGRSASPMGRGIDVGTGSGILAIAAAHFGVARMDALDIDPCALSEAARNIDHNDLGHRVSVRRRSLDHIQTAYDLVLANLRLPTLSQMADWVGDHVRAGGYLVFSGFRDAEFPDLIRTYPAPRYRRIWSGTTAGWGGVVLKKSSADPDAPLNP